jgi:hypothetical protein
VDDHGNDSRHATPLSLPGASPGELEFAGDADWFSLEVVKGNRFGFEVILDSLGDSVLRLYDQDGQTLLEINDNAAARASSSPWASRIGWEAPRSGNFYLSVRASDDKEVGRYSLGVDVLGDDHADTYASATLVGIPGLTPGNLEVPTDADVFAVRVSAGQKYRIATILGTLLDSRLRVLDADGTRELASNDDFNGNRAARLTWTAPANGTHYVQVTSFESQHQGTYDLAFSIDDHGDASITATAVTINSRTNGDVEILGDEDWFQFDAVTGVDYRLTVELQALDDSSFTLIAPDGTSVVQTNDDYHGFGSTIFFRPADAGTYFLRVDGKEGTGTYSLAVSQVADNHGNDAASAERIMVPSSSEGNIELPGDVDWFSFLAEAGVRYRIETALHDLPDSLLRLYGTDGTALLAENDNFGDLRSRIDWLAPGNATYFVETLAAGHSATGAYDVLLRELEAVAPQPVVLQPADSVVKTDRGYFDVMWTDEGGSGIDAGTVDPSDVRVMGVEVRNVTKRDGGIWRYSYDGNLSDGPVEITIPALHVADLDGNWNEAKVARFVFDAQLPRVEITEVSPDPRISNVSELLIRFSEPVRNFDLSDLTLTRNDGANRLPGLATLTRLDDRTWQLSNISALTDQPGVYRLSVLATDSGIEDFAGNRLTAGASEVWSDVRAAGDANTDGRFDQLDIVAVLQAGKYRSNQAASWSEGDWNGDGVFNQLDIVAALQTDNYLQGAYATFRSKASAASLIDSARPDRRPSEITMIPEEDFVDLVLAREAFN